MKPEQANELIQKLKITNRTSPVLDLETICELMSFLVLELDLISNQKN